MARRRLEEALQASECIGAGKNYPAKFTSVSVDHEIHLEPEVDGIYSLQYSFDGKFLAVGCGNGTIRLYETATGKKLPDIRKSRYGGYPIMVLRFHPKNPAIIYAGTSEGQVLSCDISDFVTEGATDKDKSDKDERWTEIITEKIGTERNHIYCMDFDYTYSNFVTAGKDRCIRIYDANTNQLTKEYTGYDQTKDPSSLSGGCSNRVFAIKYHPEFDEVFVTGGWDSQIKIWDSRSSQPVKRTIHGPHLSGDSLDLKGYKILTGSYHGTEDALQIWNYSTDYSTNNKEKAHSVTFPAGDKAPQLYAAQFCDNDVVVAGGSGTNSAMAINSVTQEVLGEIKFDHVVQAIDTVAGGRMFAVGDGGCRTKDEGYVKGHSKEFKSVLKLCSLK